MEIKACEKCGSLSSSEDLLTNKITCFSCGHISAGERMEFLGITEKEKILNPKKLINPFQINQRIKQQERQDGILR